MDLITIASSSGPKCTLPLAPITLRLGMGRFTCQRRLQRLYLIAARSSFGRPPQAPTLGDEKQKINLGLRTLPLVLALLVGGSFEQARQEASAREGSGDLKQAVPADPSRQEGWQLLSAGTRRRLFYKYERRIRNLSQTDKVFHYFAGSVLDDGTRVMSLADLVRAVVAVYPPESSKENRTGGLAGEPAKPKPQRQRSITAGTKDSQFLQAFDIDNDGISYSEFLLLSAFLKIPAQDVKIVFNMFDLNGDGSVHIREFEEITSALQKRLRKVSDVQRTGANIQQVDSSRGLKNHFFGMRGDKSLRLQDFADFITGMHVEILRLEFEYYDVDEDETITGLDFARSVASYADLVDVDKYLDRAAILPPELASMLVFYDDFRHFAELHQKAHELTVALDFYRNIGGKLDRADFRRATNIVTGKELPDGLVDIVFHLFQAPDGNLAHRELIALLRKRGASWADEGANEAGGKDGMLSCLYACVFK